MYFVKKNKILLYKMFFNSRIKQSRVPAYWWLQCWREQNKSTHRSIQKLSKTNKLLHLWHNIQTNKTVTYKSPIGEAWIDHVCAKIDNKNINSVKILNDYNCLSDHYPIETKYSLHENPTLIPIHNPIILKKNLVLFGK